MRDAGLVQKKTRRRWLVSCGFFLVELSATFTFLICLVDWGEFFALLASSTLAVIHEFCTLVTLLSNVCSHFVSCGLVLRGLSDDLETVAFFCNHSESASVVPFDVDCA